MDIQFQSLGTTPGAAPDDETDYDDAAVGDDGQTRPPHRLHVRGNVSPTRPNELPPHLLIHSLIHSHPLTSPLPQPPYQATTPQ